MDKSEPTFIPNMQTEPQTNTPQSTHDWRDAIQAALNHMDEGFTIYDKNLRLVAWNHRLLQLLEFPQALAYEGSPFEAFIRFNVERGEYGPGDHEQMIAERVARAREFLPHTMERVRPNGSVIEVRGNPVPGLGFVTVYKDITEKKHAEDALRESHEHLETRVKERTAELRHEISKRKQALDALRASEEWTRQITDAVPALIGYVDAQRRYQFANKRYFYWFGLSSEEIIGKTVETVLGELYVAQQEYVNAALAGQRTTSEFSLTTTSGRKIQAIATYLPHTDEDGRVLGYFILGQDVTESRKAENALRQAQKMEAIGQLTGGLAHDFNNLLTIIIGNLALAEDLPDGQDNRDLVEPALHAARRGAVLVNRLLSFARPGPLKPSVYDPKKIVPGMTELLSRTLGASIEIEIRLAGSTWPVLSDPNELENAILNLALNSRDAMPNGGKLTVAVEGQTLLERRGFNHPELPPGDYVVVSVTDTGKGMPTDIAERAFEPFYTNKDFGQGSGLGLSMVFGFARQSGGEVILLSEPEHGTRVSIYLPRHHGATPDTEKLRGRISPPEGKEHILIVEDETAVRTYTARVLQELGYQVTTAEDAAKALTLIGANNFFDLVLTDIEMPGNLNGLEFATAIQQQQPQMRILLMSGYPDKAIGQTGNLEDSFEMLNKPFEKQALAERVRELLDR